MNGKEIRELLAQVYSDVSDDWNEHAEPDESFALFERASEVTKETSQLIVKDMRDGAMREYAAMRAAEGPWGKWQFRVKEYTPDVEFPQHVFWVFDGGAGGQTFTVWIVDASPDHIFAACQCGASDCIHIGAALAQMRDENQQRPQSTERAG